MDEQMCIDCGALPAQGSDRCGPCAEMALLLQARAALAGRPIVVTLDHLRALDRCITAQADAIIALQRELQRSAVLPC